MESISTSERGIEQRGSPPGDGLQRSPPGITASGNAAFSGIRKMTASDRPVLPQETGSLLMQDQLSTSRGRRSPKL